MSLDFDILGAGIAAPGLPDWPSLQRALAGQALASDTTLPPSALLSPRERRRAPAAVKLSFSAAEQACSMAALAPAVPVAVFSSGMGDLDITDYMCRTLAESPELLSPTRFHNSVHNAASGYWSIGAGATGDVTAISGWQDSVTAGLFEALSRIACDPQPVLLVMYDDTASGPMRDLWPCLFSFSAALLIGPPGQASALARLQARAIDGAESRPNLPSTLIDRMNDNPAARVLPLLALIADDSRPDVTLAAEQGPGLAIGRRT
jgi:hypothetical protein